MRSSANTVAIVVAAQLIFGAMWFVALAGPKATLGGVATAAAAQVVVFGGAIALAMVGRWLAPHYMWAVESWRQRRLAAGIAALEASAAAKVASPEPPVATYRTSAAPIPEDDPVARGKVASVRQSRRLELGLAAFCVVTAVVAFALLLGVR